MAKQIIIGKNVETGQKRLFENLEEASRLLGVSLAAVSVASSTGKECSGWLFRRVDRIYALRCGVHKEWVVAVMNNRNNGYLEYENPARKIGMREINQKREITLGWYEL